MEYDTAEVYGWLDYGKVTRDVVEKNLYEYSKAMLDRMTMSGWRTAIMKEGKM